MFSKKIIDQYGKISEKIKSLEKIKEELNKKIKEEMKHRNIIKIEGDKYEIQLIEAENRVVKPEIVYNVFGGAGDRFFSVLKVSAEALVKEIGKSRFDELSEMTSKTKKLLVKEM